MGKWTKFIAAGTAAVLVGCDKPDRPKGNTFKDSEPKEEKAPTEEDIRRIKERIKEEAISNIRGIGRGSLVYTPNIIDIGILNQNVSDLITGDGGEYYLEVKAKADQLMKPVARQFGLAELNGEYISIGGGNIDPTPKDVSEARKGIFGADTQTAIKLFNSLLANLNHLGSLKSSNRSSSEIRFGDWHKGR